jgi:hypothetical protein
MRDGSEGGRRELLSATAIREGIEELGLMLPGLHRLLELGPYGFSSIKTGRSKNMWLFAAEMSSQEEVLPMAEVASTTFERRWMTHAQFAVEGREDHRYILKDIERKLQLYYKE